jgi:hypothetical protein
MSKTTWSGFLSKAYVCPRISVQSVFQEVVQYANRLVSVQKTKHDTRQLSSQAQGSVHALGRQRVGKRTQLA